MLELAQLLPMLVAIPAGWLNSWIQDNLGWQMPGVLTSIVLAVAYTIAVYLVVFVAGFNIFGDVPTVQALTEILLTFVLSFSNSQASYSVQRKYEAKYGKPPTFGAVPPA